jgi:rubrerythrin
MIIRLELSFLNQNVRSIIINSEEIKSFSIDSSKDVDYTTNRTDHHIADEKNSNNTISIDYNKGSMEDFKGVLQDILARNHLKDFTVAEDMEAENTVAILREGDLEQFGLYICKHCGTTFKSIDERMLHERIHYFV